MVNVTKKKMDQSQKYKKIVNKILELFELWVNYYKYETPKDTPKINNTEGVEALHYIYFKRAPEEIYEYLNTTKNNFINLHTSKIEDRITFISDAELTEIEIKKTKKFLISIGNIIFKYIQEISVDVLKNYVKNLNRQEAESRTEAIIINRNNASAISATAEAIEKEDKIQAKNMMGLIDKKSDIVVLNLDKAKKKKSGKKKGKTVDLTEITNIFPETSAAARKFIPKKKVNFSETHQDQMSVLELGQLPN